MCGICGIIGLPEPEATKAVTAMCRSLAHRGPDDEHVVAGPNWALGHRRLSIIDLSQRARQPFSGEAGTTHLAANGEIYNFVSLRDSLVAKGHVFTSRSDCEVILHLLEEDGSAAIPQLEGMFACAFVDTQRRQLILCRDRLGIKPLYLRRAEGTVAFASEIKALYACDGKGAARPAVAQERLGEYFQYRYVSGRATLFKDVQELLPGHMVIIDLDSLALEEKTYWSPAMRRSVGPPGDDRAVAEQLETSIRAHLVSDVPLGCQLSGGLDSSLVTALAMQMVDRPMHTFSVGFAGYEKDEACWAADVGAALGTLHHPVPYAEQDFLGDLAQCTYLHDEPLNHANSLPMYKLCREARRHVTVLLTGEGADELFGGYSWHRRLWRLARLGSVAQVPWVGKLARRLAPRRLEPMLPLLGQSPRAMAGLAAQWLSAREVAQWLHAAPSTRSYRATVSVSTRDPLAAVLDMDLRTYLVSVLQRQDRMSMASGVESRVPFLDHALVELVLKIPVEQHFADGRGKAVLRRIARGRIPDGVIERPKTGFSLPLASWMRNPHGLGALLPWLYGEQAAARGIWDIDVVRSMAVEHAEGQVNHADALWIILAFEIWARLWLDGVPHEILKTSIMQACAEN
jgi:asparagine synthase (glutamine-hydrolysing)